MIFLVRMGTSTLHIGAVWYCSQAYRRHPPLQTEPTVTYHARLTLCRVAKELGHKVYAKCNIVPCPLRFSPLLFVLGEHTMASYALQPVV